MAQFAVTHELGAALLLYHFLENENLKPFCLSTGPSSHLPAKFGLQSFDLDQIEELIDNGENVSYLGSTPSNFSSVVMPFLQLFGARKCEKILILDNWVNYRNRMGDLIPDSILVFDELAAEYAADIFPNRKSSIKLVTNYYLEFCRNQLESGYTKSENILFVEVNDNEFTNFSNFKNGRYCICPKLKKLCEIYKERRIIFRQHPSTLRESCFFEFIAEYPQYAHTVVLSQNLELIEDLRIVSLVLGLPSYALYLAQELGFDVKTLEETNNKWHGPIFNRLTL